MDIYVHLVYHHGGTWRVNDNEEPEYIHDEELVYPNFDPDFLSYNRLLKTYQIEVGYRSISRIFVLKPGRSLKDGLFLVHDDETIKKVLRLIQKNSWVTEIDIYGDTDVDVPIFQPQILGIDWHALVDKISGTNSTVHYPQILWNHRFGDCM